MIGIYKITNPKGRIYIGQSRNIERRRQGYARRVSEQQRGLYNSILKYGFSQHLFEVVEECLVEELNAKERYWQDFYRVLEEGLNLRLTETEDRVGYFSDSTKERIAEGVRSTKSKMTDQEYFEKYVENHLGVKGNMYGKKRPGEQAGNYGTSKGGYTLISPDGTRQDFEKLVDILRYGVNESTIRNWRNKGTIIPQPNNNRCKWIGYSIEYRRNTKYGEAYKKSSQKKRKLE